MRHALNFQLGLHARGPGRDSYKGVDEWNAIEKELGGGALFRYVDAVVLFSSLLPMGSSRSRQ